ncbi:Mis12-like protein [Thalictrum thalictroides]|uniref:Mis12-like protein n=1 Tax=Thalictrum thalictroides TaxID=46969 RepID=A0A7J6V7P7_THATH|nr:Mis12-like protein [Thalictrum thalictroides]
MEDGESENVFGNLNPQLFINEVINGVNDVVDEGFEVFEQQALELLGDVSEDETNQLRKDKGVSSISGIIQEALDKRLDMWEKYNLQHCFSVPEGFSLPKTDTSGDTLMDHDACTDAELDKQLDYLREKLSEERRKSEELQRELHAVRKQSITNMLAESVNESLKQLEQTSVQDSFQEMMKMAAELQGKMESLKKKGLAEMESSRTKRIYCPNNDQTLVHPVNGFSDMDLSSLQEFESF